MWFGWRGEDRTKDFPEDGVEARALISIIRRLKKEVLLEERRVGDDLIPLPTHTLAVQEDESWRSFEEEREEFVDREEPVAGVEGWRRSQVWRGHGLGGV